MKQGEARSLYSDVKKRKEEKDAKSLVKFYPSLCLRPLCVQLLPPHFPQTDVKQGEARSLYSDVKKRKEEKDAKSLVKFYPFFVPSRSLRSTSSSSLSPNRCEDKVRHVLCTPMVKNAKKKKTQRV